MVEKIAMPMKKSSTSYKMIIPEDVSKKIQFTCSKVWNTEWSGILFYTFEGSFENNDLIIICKDIFLMDIGSHAYTEFDMSPDVIAYMAQNPELLDYQLGLIHSHCTFDTFFSGTDLNTLAIEGKDRNNFVSLIVNNAGTYTAAITRQIIRNNTVKSDISYTQFDETIPQDSEEFTNTETSIEYFNLNIQIEGERADYKDLSERLNELYKNKSTKFTPLSDKPAFLYNAYPDSLKETARQMSLFEEYSEDIEDLSASKDIVDSMAAQIVTGCVTVSAERLGDLTKVNMLALYDKRFKDNPNEFKDFAELLTDMLVLNYKDPKLKNVDEVTRTNILVESLLEVLNKLPNNKYLDEFKQLLNTYIYD